MCAPGAEVGDKADQVQLGPTRQLMRASPGRALVSTRPWAGQLRRDRTAERVAGIAFGVTLTSVRLWLTSC